MNTNAILVSVLVSLQAAQQPATKLQFGNYAAITSSRLKAHLEFVAHDLLEGRDTPSRGQDIAAWYVATQLKLWGAKPAGENNTYFQELPNTTTVIDRERTFMTVGGEKLAYGSGWFAPARKLSISGSCVYVGHGYVMPNSGIDPYAGVDLRGKAVLVSGTPRGFSQEMLRTGQSIPPQRAAFEKGAAALIVVRDASSSDFRRMADAYASTEGEEGQQPDRPVIYVNRRSAAKLLSRTDSEFDSLLSDVESFKPSDTVVGTASLRLEVAVRSKKIGASNVVAVIPGSDPVLSKEYVAFGAHIDHVGINPNMSPDGIYNGADDDGSGTVSILEIAHAFATGKRPLRSLLFVWHTGEEKGLWGSAHFTNNPTIDLKNVIAQLNIDMIGRSRAPGDTDSRNEMLTGPNAIYVVGSRRISSDLGDICAAVNKSLYNLTYNYHYDTPNEPENIYERSDHYMYAQKGIPIAFWFDGVHVDYHQPGDEVSKIDFTKMERIARTIYATGWTLANRKQKLSRNQN